MVRPRKGCHDSLRCSMLIPRLSEDSFLKLFFWTNIPSRLRSNQHEQERAVLDRFRESWPPFLTNLLSISDSAQNKNGTNSYRTKDSNSPYAKSDLKLDEYQSKDSKVFSSDSSKDGYQGHSSDEEKSNKRRRWSAPDQLDAEDEFIDPGSPSPVQKRMKD